MAEMLVKKKLKNETSYYSAGSKSFWYSEGIVSRSFISKLHRLYPEAVIDVHYFMSYSHEYDKKLLAVDSITEHKVNGNLLFWLKSQTLFMKSF
jgi:hypothetical protein